MTVTIDIQELKDLQLRPDQYLWLRSVFDTGNPPDLPLMEDLSDLQAKGFIKIVEDKVELREKALTMFTLPDKELEAMFAELLSSYPLKVTTRSGTRVLHAADPMALANRKLFRTYKKILGRNRAKHKEIISLLNIQLDHQRDNLQYLQGLEVWLNQRTWEKWKGIDTEPKDDGRTATVL